MRQSQFDQLLAWMMIQTLNTAVISQQMQLGRELTEEEFLECHRNTHKAAEDLMSFFAENRQKEPPQRG